jgi:hypothetical protein
MAAFLQLLGLAIIPPFFYDTLIGTKNRTSGVLPHDFVSPIGWQKIALALTKGGGRAFAL